MRDILSHIRGRHICTVSDNPDPESFDSLYHLLKIKDEPMSPEHPKLDTYCFPDLFP